MSGLSVGARPLSVNGTAKPSARKPHPASKQRGRRARGCCRLEKIAPCRGGFVSAGHSVLPVPLLSGGVIDRAAEICSVSQPH